MQIPVIYSTDVAVFGARSGAVAAALAVRAAGRTVVAISDRSYFGEETAGTLQLSTPANLRDPLVAAAFAHGSATSPVMPGQIKRTLETALLEQNIPFLYACRPVFVLRDEGGALVGIVLAARSALYAVTCSVMVDASRTGLLARLAGLPLSKRETGRHRTLAVIGVTPPPDAVMPWEPTQLSYAVRKGQVEERQLVCHLQAPAAEVPNTFAAKVTADHYGRASVLYPGIQHSADTWVEVLGERLADGDCAEVDCADKLLDHAFVRCDGRLVIMNELLPLTLSGAETLSQMVGQVECGRRAGQIAARQSAELPKTQGRLACTAGQVAAGGELRFATPFVRQRDVNCFLDVDLTGVPVLGQCDVLVAGGGASGAPAGISAARAGAETIVVERLHGLGGLGTLGLIATYYLGNRVGFTTQIDNGLAEFCGEPDKQQKSRWSPEDKMSWYMKALRDAGGAAWLNSFVFGVQMEGAQVNGVLVATPFGSGLVRTSCVIDATGNADLAAAAGAPCRQIDAKHVAYQGTGLSPRILGKDTTNTDHTFIDENDLIGVTHAFVNARAKFHDQFDVTPLIGTRERRQIIGEIELSPLDFLAQRTFSDTMVTAASNFDTHGFTVHPVFLVTPPDKSVLRAHVPFRCMLPRGVEGMLATGLGVSAHRDAMPVIRMQPDVQNQGYAAGLAAAMAVASGGRLRDVDIRKVQAHLVEVGILEPDVLTHSDALSLSDQAVRDAVERGLVDTFSSAIIFSHPEISIPLCLAQLQTSSDPHKREDAALVLGLFGRGEAGAALADLVQTREWDEGWNYTGMGQFGMSMSRMDALVVALGKTRNPIAVSPLLEKIRALDEASWFSHCRAVSVAASALGDPALAEALYELLQKPGMQGHAYLDTARVIANVNYEPNETEARNASLKELILGRGLYLCGDWKGLGQHILQTYANDLRGPYARHAQAVLECRCLDELRAEVL